MSALEQMLAAQDDAALEALASVGLLRRAKAALEKPGAVEAVELGPERAVLRIEGFEVMLGPEGPAAARCDCPATGMCRHMLMAVLHLRAGAGSAPERPSAQAEIAGLSLSEIESFAGADWPQALRIAAVSAAVPSDATGGASSVVNLPDAPGPVTFLAGGGLRKALFKGPEGRRRRFVAAAALVLGGHALPEPQEASAQVDPALLAEAAAAVTSALTHGLRGDPRLAQDRLFDLAVSARADAVPRLAATLRALARQAGLLASRDPEGDPLAWLGQLAEAHALIRALGRAPTDAVLTGQLRRDYSPAAPFDLAVLGVAQWRTRTGARGLTIHGWDGTRFLATGPARAAGADPGFTPSKAYHEGWWHGKTPARMTGAFLHLSSPRLSPDGMLPGQVDSIVIEGGLQPDKLPFHDNWDALRADLATRQGIGLRTASRPAPALVHASCIAVPRFDAISQQARLDIGDRAGRGLALCLPDMVSGQAIYEAQHRVVGLLIEAVREMEGISFRLISLYFGDPLHVWNVTLETAPKALNEGEGVLDTLGATAHRLTRPTVAAVRETCVAALAKSGIEVLLDAICTPGEARRTQALAAQAEALGLSRIAQGFSRLDPLDSNAALELAWELTLVRRATQL